MIIAIVNIKLNYGKSVITRNKLVLAVTFLEYWKRKSASLAHHWDCMGFQDEIERPRPEFAARAPFLERNPVTGIQEPSFPRSLRNKRIAAGLGIVFLMVCLNTCTLCYLNILCS